MLTTGMRVIVTFFSGTKCLMSQINDIYNNSIDLGKLPKGVFN